MAASANNTSDWKPVASTQHTVIFVLINLAIGLGGAALQKRPTSGAGLVSSHRSIVPLYLTMIGLEWLFLYYVWQGVRKQRVRLFSLVGGRWKSLREVVLDLGIVIPFWIVWEATAWLVNFLLGRSHAKTVDFLLPRTVAEVLLWWALSVSAGFCEELIYRGYFQRQLQAFTANRVIAVLGQAVVFGVAHAYQGWKAVVVITVLGVLYGWLAVWRNSLRPGMIAHAWSDIYEGYLKFFWLAHA